LEKELQDYLGKLHGSVFTNCEVSFKKLENSLEKLNDKILEVDGEMKGFTTELKAC
jgi:methyl-accepting chemotaxis protein